MSLVWCTDLISTGTEWDSAIKTILNPDICDNMEESKEYYIE